jgi:hypothetical protein
MMALFNTSTMGVVSRVFVIHSFTASVIGKYSPINFKAAKNKEFFYFKFKMSFEQEKFLLTKT